MLIGIYGEEILEYVFLNDPLGFLLDNRFYNIVGFTKCLDNYYLSEEEIMVLSYMKKDLEEEIQKSEASRKDIKECIERTISRHNEALSRLFELIITEYFSYNNCKLEKDLFISKLSSFISNKKHAPIFVFDRDYTVRRKIQSSIDAIK